MASLSKKWVIIIPIVIGVAVLVFLKKSKNTPVQNEITEVAKLVRVISAPSVTVIPRAIGHGTVRPSTTWEAVAEVKGKILEKHPRLEKGGILESGTLLYQIDPTDYKLAIAQTQADIQAIEAQLQELVTKTANTKAALTIENAALALNEKELERKRKLIGKGGVSRSDLESQEQMLLAQKQKLQSQKNTLNLLPSQEALLQAQLASKHARLASAQRDLEQTQVMMPFTGRIAEVNVEQNQYIREGEILAVADGMQLAEVEAQIPIEQMSNLIRSDHEVNLMAANGGDHAPAFGLSATVRLKEGALNADWQGRFARISDTLDPKTRTVGVIIEVDEPYAKVQPGVRPPLFKGLFVQLDLYGRPRPDSLVIPRLALHDGVSRSCEIVTDAGCPKVAKVYLVNSDSRLELREVEVGMIQPEFVVVDKGLKAGEQVVVSDLIPAISGMLLKPTEDEQGRVRLIQLATAGATQP
ncbi:MAG: biotin/lipoyl-binding protein [Pseudomonadota bacterium]